MDSSLKVIILKAIALPLFAIFLVGKFNIFDSITFVPNEYSFEIGLTSYIAILDFIYFKLSKYIDLNHKASIECLFYSDKLSKKITNIPSVSFIEDVSYINCCITVKGGAKKLAKNALIISFPNWVDLQQTNGSAGIINDKNQFVIELGSIICIDDKIVEVSTVDIKIGLIRNQSPNNYSTVVAPIIKKQFMMQFAFNESELCN